MVKEGLFLPRRYGYAAYNGPQLYGNGEDAPLAITPRTARRLYALAQFCRREGIGLYCAPNNSWLPPVLQELYAVVEGTPAEVMALLPDNSLLLCPAHKGIWAEELRKNLTAGGTGLYAEWSGLAMACKRSCMQFVAYQF